MTILVFYNNGIRSIYTVDDYEVIMDEKLNEKMVFFYDKVKGVNRKIPFNVLQSIEEDKEE